MNDGEEKLIFILFNSFQGSSGSSSEKGYIVSRYFHNKYIQRKNTSAP